MAAPRLPQRFCAPDADLTVCSSDGVLFKVHRQTLEACSGVFAGAADATRPENGDETVDLTESANVLEILFQCMYATSQQPDLRTLDFSTLSDLAEAAEKYMVYSVVKLCRLQMEASIFTHPLEVFLYALRHDHIHLANDSVQQSMRCTRSQALEILPPDTFGAWISFHERWHRETARSLAYMATFPKHFSLVQKCTADPNPACTFRKELDEAGGWSRTIREMKFMTDPKIARMQYNILRPCQSPVVSVSTAVFSF
ncbi:hypothetical protein MSAN_01642600 [Mycena sanguinolenta]|uniref:BTB domain-containing protein n=1 Tax=Mycena sanguinolenta TaxID=230812 RepID=A0A8H6Y308_9AGAR|nr:hypothetical protein MSAN_01642600 [Mycena sanguinolenta]